MNPQHLILRHGLDSKQSKHLILRHGLDSKQSKNLILRHGLNGKQSFLNSLRLFPSSARALMHTLNKNTTQNHKPDQPYHPCFCAGVPVLEVHREENDQNPPQLVKLRYEQQVQIQTLLSSVVESTFGWRRNTAVE